MRITPARDPMKTTPAREGDLPGSCYSKLHLLRMPAQQPPFAVRGRIRPVFGALRRAWCGASLAGLNRQRVARDVASLWVPQEGKEKRVLQTNGFSFLKKKKPFVCTVTLNVDSSGEAGAAAKTREAEVIAQRYAHNASATLEK